MAELINACSPEVINHMFDGCDDELATTPTPISRWNAACYNQGGGEGLGRSWMVTIAGTPGSGKTTLALNIAAEALRDGQRVGFLSLEMDQRLVRRNLAAIVSGSSAKHLAGGNKIFDGEEAFRAAQSLAKLNGAALWVNEKPFSNAKDVKDAANEMVSGQGCQTLIVDYLQLISAPDEESLFKQVTATSMWIRELASIEEITAIGLSQFNRGTSGNRDQRPTMFGLMGGSPLENNSDQVVLLDHSRYTRDHETAKTWVLVEKNRHGPTMEIPVAWDYRTLRIREAYADEVTADDWP